MGTMDRFFRKASKQQSTSTSTRGDELVALACDLLSTQIDLCNASINGVNRKRLEEPYARGKAMGALFIGDAISDQSPDSMFREGRRAGAAELFQWLRDDKIPPLMLTDYLNGLQH
jgi:hypothetical protein